MIPLCSMQSVYCIRQYGAYRYTSSRPNNFDCSMVYISECSLNNPDRA